MDHDEERPRTFQFVPWQAGALAESQTCVASLLANSYLPTATDEGLKNEVLAHTYESLSPASTCRICDLLDSLVNHTDPSIAFFEDYALLCYVCSRAPRAWLSTVIAAVDFTRLLMAHFPEAGSLDTLFMPHRLLAVDVQLHFFVNRCFLPITTTQMIHGANLGYYRIEFLRAILTGQGPATFCFKSMWPKPQEHMKVRGVATSDTSSSFKRKEIQSMPRGQICCLLSNELDRVMVTHEGPESLVFDRSKPWKHDFCDFLTFIWEGTDLLEKPDRYSIVINGQMKDSVNSLFSSFKNWTPPGNVDTSQGPSLLAPMFGLKKKNASRTICPLCEILAGHPDAKSALDRLKARIVASFGNNIKILDRIAFILKDSHTFLDVSCPRLKTWLSRCSSQDFHKHLFCDPMCAINHKTTDHGVLFGLPKREHLAAFRAALANGEHLENRVCDELITLTYIFKSAQVSRINKTILVDVTKELDAALRRHGLETIQTYQTSQIYV
ncbi:ORF62 [callitrichine gammaherpesvirus 3]|uniref:Packaging protein UL32 n=1 Tax=callitrichine gammaherpesvirus 3 TaxID=106331 RepID=Q8BEN4_9GAMA|nr:ORF62 [callitrichine gammaherpesvirus 3]AAN64283.1 ORF62 [callitrichine gammaherpesvirus 3]